MSGFMFARTLIWTKTPVFLKLKWNKNKGKPSSNKSRQEGFLIL